MPDPLLTDEELLELETYGLYDLADWEIVELRDYLQRSVTEIRALRKVIQTILDDWWDKIYPADVFVGGPNADAGVNDVVRLRNLMRSVLPGENDG